MIVIEITAAIDAAGTLQTFYLSEERLVTGPTDMPPNVAYTPCIIDPGSIGLTAYSDGRTGGATKLQTGEIILANSDGQFDAWVNYSFDGRPVTIRSGTAGGAYPGSFATIMVGTADGVLATWNQVTINLKDKQFKFDLPARTALYGGTNILPAGLDGTPSDLQGKARPVAYGKVLNVSPPMVNTSLLISEVGVCQSVDAVYDNGVALTAGSIYTSQSDMLTNTPSAGNFRAWPAGGYFRLGSSPAGTVTADVTQGSAPSSRTVAQVIQRLALDAGLSSAEISAPDVAALDALNSAVVGVWIDDASMTFTSAMDQIAASIGAWYGFDAIGVLRMGQLVAPIGTPVVTLHDYDCQDGIERRPPMDNGTPIWSATANYAKNWTVQSSGLAGSVSAARMAYLAQETRSANAADASIKTQWQLADVLSIDTLLISLTDAGAEAARLLALQKVRRDVFDVPVNIDIFTGNGLRLMLLVGLQLPRFGMGTGRVFLLIGFALNLAQGTVILTLWG